MTREHCQREREAFNAFCDGREIESRAAGSQGPWIPCPTPAFSNYNEHRIAQKPVDVEELRKLVEKWRKAGYEITDSSQIIYLYHSDALERVLNGGKA